VVAAFEVFLFILVGFNPRPGFIPVRKPVALASGEAVIISGGGVSRRAPEAKATG